MESAYEPIKKVLHKTQDLLDELSSACGECSPAESALLWKVLSRDNTRVSTLRSKLANRFGRIIVNIEERHETCQV